MRSNKIRLGVAAVVGAAVLATLGTAPFSAVAATAPSSAATAAASAQAVDISSLHVVYQGTLISNDRAEQLRSQREKAHEEFAIVYDHASSEAGIAHAFNSRAAAAAYLHQVGLAQQQRAATAVAVRPLSLPTGCPDAKNISRMYEAKNCGGTDFAFLLTENDKTFGNVGWNNRGESLVVGHTTSGCIILIQLYPGVNYTFTEADFYGDTTAQYYLFNSAQKDNFESGHSSCH